MAALHGIAADEVTKEIEDIVQVVDTPLADDVTLVVDCNSEDEVNAAVTWTDREIRDDVLHLGIP